MFEVLGAVGAWLEERPPGTLRLFYRVPPDMSLPPVAAEGIPVEESPDIGPGMTAVDAADVVELRLSRHYAVKRIEDRPMSGVIAEWALSERSASPGLDQPET